MGRGEGLSVKGRKKRHEDAEKKTETFHTGKTVASRRRTGQVSVCVCVRVRMCAYRPSQRGDSISQRQVRCGEAGERRVRRG